MRILGIDPGTGILGFGVIDVDKSSKMKLVDAGVIRTPVHEDDSVRLLTIYNELKSIILEFKPEVMSVEKLFFARNVTTAMTVNDTPRTQLIDQLDVVETYLLRCARFLFALFHLGILYRCSGELDGRGSHRHVAILGLVG